MGLVLLPPGQLSLPPPLLSLFREYAPYLVLLAKFRQLCHAQIIKLLLVQRLMFSLKLLSELGRSQVRRGVLWDSRGREVLAVTIAAADAAETNGLLPLSSTELLYNIVETFSCTGAF